MTQQDKAEVLDFGRGKTCAGVIKVFLVSLFVEEGFNCSCLKCADRNAVMSWKAAEGFVYC